MRSDSSGRIAAATAFIAITFIALCPAWAPSAAQAQDLVKVAKTVRSACAGLALDACQANIACVWHRAGKLKSGKTRKAHCQKKPVRSAKKASPT